MGLTVSRQTAQLKCNRQRQKCRLILAVKKFQGDSNLTISAYLHGLLAPKESLNWKNYQLPKFSKLITLSRYNKTSTTCFIYIYLSIYNP